MILRTTWSEIFSVTGVELIRGTEALGVVL